MISRSHQSRSCTIFLFRSMNCSSHKRIYKSFPLRLPRNSWFFHFSKSNIRKVKSLCWCCQTCWENCWITWIAYIHIQVSENIFQMLQWVLRWQALTLHNESVAWNCLFRQSHRLWWLPHLNDRCRSSSDFQVEIRNEQGTEAEILSHQGRDRFQCI